jgi:hypothetical protein
MLCASNVCASTVLMHATCALKFQQNRERDGASNVAMTAKMHVFLIYVNLRSQQPRLPARSVVRAENVCSSCWLRPSPRSWGRALRLFVSRKCHACLRAGVRAALVPAAVAHVGVANVGELEAAPESRMFLRSAGLRCYLQIQTAKLPHSRDSREPEVCFGLTPK